MTFIEKKYRYNKKKLPQLFFIMKKEKQVLVLLRMAGVLIKITKFIITKGLQ
jgi:hypothetical protein